MRTLPGGGVAEDGSGEIGCRLLLWWWSVVVVAVVVLIIVAA
jgi:hypothetical protein